MSCKDAIIGFQDGVLYLEGVQQLKAYLHIWTWQFTAVHRLKKENCTRSEPRFTISLRVLKSSSGGFIVKRGGYQCCLFPQLQGYVGMYSCQTVTQSHLALQNHLLTDLTVIMIITSITACCHQLSSRDRERDRELRKVPFLTRLQCIQSQELSKQTWREHTWCMEG